jgi:ABC-2 type transport system permease protein
MKRLIRAELLKLRTTRDLLWTAVGAPLFVLASVALAIKSGSIPGDAPLDSGAGVRSVMAAASSGSLLVLLLGITGTAGEYRHGTAVTTFLVTPDRQRTLLAKLVAAALVGLAVSAAACALTAAVAVPWFGAEGISLDGRADDMAVAGLGSLAVTALAGVIGVGFGTLMRNQTAAVVTALVWTVAVESIVAGLVPELYRWLPGGAQAAVTGSASVADTFALGGGLLLTLGYAAAFAVAGRFALLQRDLA